MVEVDVTRREPPVLLAELPPELNLVPIRLHGSVLQRQLVELPLELLALLLDDLSRRLPHAPRGDDPLHIPPPVDFEVVGVRLGADADPAVRRVAEEGFEGPDLRREARERGDPEVGVGVERRGRGSVEQTDWARGPGVLLFGSEGLERAECGEREGEERTSPSNSSSSATSASLKPSTSTPRTADSSSVSVRSMTFEPSARETTAG